MTDTRTPTAKELRLQAQKRAPHLQAVTHDAQETGDDAQEVGEVRHQPGSCPWADGLDLPEGYTTPTDYEGRRGGIWYIKPGTEKTEPVPTQITSAPLFVTAVYVDPHGEQLVDLTWRDHETWVTRTVPRSVVKSGRKLVATLGDVGVPFIETDARQVERFLSRLESVNADLIPRRRLARWLGWQPGGEFVSAQDEPFRVEPTYPEQLPALRAHHEGGTAEGWREAVAVLEHYPVVHVILSAAFASVLLDVLRLDSFTLDVSGRSTRGKTTAAKVALSAWACPSERSDGIASWRTTMIAAEKRLNLVRGLPVVLDETRVVKFPELVDQVVYQVPKNHGAARGGGYPSLLPWRTVVISTGEQKVTTFTTHQGANARVLTIATPPFPAGSPDVGAQAARLGEQVALHYGHAGPAFAERVRKALEHDGAADALRSRHEGVSEHFKGTTDISGRRAPLAGALYLAAQLAHEWSIVPVPVPDLELWQKVLVDDTEGSQEDNRGEQALDVVREYVAAHGGEFWIPKRLGLEPPHGWAGRIYAGKDTDGKECVAVMATKLRDILIRSGHVLDAVLPAWKEAGVLVKFSGDKPFSPSKPVGDGRARVYVFAPGLVELRSDRLASGGGEGAEGEGADAEEEHGHLDGM